MADLSKEDNLQLAQAAQAIVAAFGALHDKGLIPDEALVDLSYRFAGELVDVEEVLGRSHVSQPWHSQAKMARRPRRR